MIQNLKNAWVQNVDNTVRKKGDFFCLKTARRIWWSLKKEIKEKRGGGGNGEETDSALRAKEQRLQNACS